MKFQLVFVRFRAEVKKVTSRAELKILLLKLWLEPAWLGLVTTKHFYSLPGDYQLMTMLS